ncbi:hypothetical protein BHM03_00022127, partial [Ensete ventricosum]
VGSESSSGIGPEFGRCSENSSGDHRKLAEGIGGLSGVCRKLAKLSRACREFTGSSPRVIGSLPGVRWELVKGDREFTGSSRELNEGDWELAENAPGFCKKMTETRRKFSEVAGKIAWS